MEGRKFRAFYDPPDGCTASIPYNENVQVNKWYYLAKTSDGTSANFYVNGDLVGSATVSLYILTKTSKM